MEKKETDIEKARLEFGLKEFENCLVTYNTIPVDQLNELDKKIIEHYRKYIDLKK